MIAKMILKMSEQVKAIVKKLVVGCYVFLRVETRCEWSEERVPRQDQEGEAFKRGCRKAMVGPRSCDLWRGYVISRRRRSWWHGAYLLSLRGGGVVCDLRGTNLRLSQSLAPAYVVLLCLSLLGPPCLYRQGKRVGWQIWQVTITIRLHFCSCRLCKERQRV